VGLVLVVDPANSKNILNSCKNSWILGEIQEKSLNQKSSVIIR
jgi:hypothetical protein